MEKNKHKILVLSDMNESVSTMLKSTVSLAKIINGEIHFLTVKKPSEIVKEESQLSAMRNINQEHFAVKKSILSLIEPISEAYNVSIKNTLTYGNVKNEIGNYIKDYQPDVVVLGKRKSKILKLAGDNIAQFVFKQHKGTIMISAYENALEPDKKLTLGLLNDLEASFEFSNHLMDNTQKPVKSFRVVKSSNLSEKASNINNKEIVEYVFEDNNDVLNNISNYLSKNNINLLCVNREKKTSENNKYLMKSDINSVIDKLNVSLLLTAN